MSDLIARKGDVTICLEEIPGEIIEGSPDTFCEGSEVARNGDKIFCPIHGEQEIIGTGGCLVNDELIAVDGDVAECGAEIQAGSTKSYA